MQMAADLQLLVQLSEVAQGVGAIATVLGITFLVRQTRLLAQQQRDARLIDERRRKIAEATSYGSLGSLMVHVDCLFAEHPDLRAYAYGDKGLPEAGTVERTRAWLAAETVLDVLDVYSQQDALLEQGAAATGTPSPAISGRRARQYGRSGTSGSTGIRSSCAQSFGRSRSRGVNLGARRHLSHQTERAGCTAFLPLGGVRAHGSSEGEQPADKVGVSPLLFVAVPHRRVAARRQHQQHLRLPARGPRCRTRGATADAAFARCRA